MAPVLRVSRELALALAALLVPASAAFAATLSAGIGADYSTGPSSQSVRDVLGYVQTSSRAADLTVAAARFNSSQVGAGVNTTVAFTWNASPKLSVQAIGGRAVAEADYRSSRIQVGPVFPFAGGTWGISYFRADDTFGPSTNGFASEIGLPLTPRLIGIGRGSVASVDGGGTNLQGPAGLIWGVAQRLLLVGELGMGRDATALASSAPAPGGVGIPGREPGAARDYVTGPALSVGIRYVLR